MNTKWIGSNFTFWTYMYAGCLLLCNKCLGNLRCLSCRDVARPRYCEYLQTCGEHEECYVDSYATVSGTVRYNLGCRDRKMCALTTITPRAAVLSLRTTQIPICNECCGGDLCNQAGCGEQGFPNNFGQLCFNCHQQLHPTDCDKIMLCGENEICKISSREIAGDMVYVTGCELSLVCSRDYYQIVGRRDNSCAQCCNSTLCNNACESSRVKCENKIPNCYQYSNEMCRRDHPFYDWAKEYCLEKCGLCHLHAT